MDREAREHYTVVIQAKDMAGQVGGLSGSTTINITLTDINDNPPKFPQSMLKSLINSEILSLYVPLGILQQTVSPITICLKMCSPLSVLSATV